MHLYDELPYPSGPAGGEVLLGNPQFYATELVQKAINVEGEIAVELPRGKILNCVAVPLRDGSRIGVADRSIKLHGRGAHREFVSGSRPHFVQPQAVFREPGGAHIGDDAAAGAASPFCFGSGRRHRSQILRPVYRRAESRGGGGVHSADS